VEAVQEVVVVVHGEVGGARPALDNRLDVVDHVDVGIGGEVRQLAPVEQGDEELAQGVAAASPVGIGHHGVVGVVVVAQLQVVREQDVGQSGALLWNEKKILIDDVWLGGVTDPGQGSGAFLTP
jgi:hypothetical protein